MGPSAFPSAAGRQDHRVMAGTGTDRIASSRVGRA